MSTEPQKLDKSMERGERFLSFSLGGEEYAIPLLSVKEVIAVPEITPIPFSPVHFMGIMNLRGQVISVVDLRKKLAIKPREGSETAIIICDLAPLSIGVVVDSINSVVFPRESELSERPEAQGGRSNEYMLGVYKKDRNLVILLDIAKTLDARDYLAVKSNQSKATA